MVAGLAGRGDAARTKGLLGRPGGVETGAVMVARNAVRATKTATAAPAIRCQSARGVGGAASDDGALEVDEDSVRVRRHAIPPDVR